MLAVQGLVFAGPAIGLAKGVEQYFRKDVDPAVIWSLMLVGVAAFAAIRWIVTQPSSEEREEAKQQQAWNDANSGVSPTRKLLVEMGLAEPLDEVHRQYEFSEISHGEYLKRHSAIWDQMVAEQECRWEEARRKAD